MSLKDCIRSSVAQGHLTKEEGQALEKRYNELAREILAPAEIKAQLAHELEQEALQRKRIALLAEDRRLDLEKKVDAYRTPAGKASPGEAVKLLIANEGKARFDDVYYKSHAIVAEAQSRMEELLYEFRKGAFTGDLRRRYGKTAARLDNVVQELFGDDSGDVAAKGLAKAWSEVAEYLRQRFNAAGGAVGKLDKWGLPQAHAQDALLRAGKDAWIKFIEPLLDHAKMRSALTGEPFEKARLADVEGTGARPGVISPDMRQALEHVYETIVSAGWNTREATSRPSGEGALFSRHADHRFLIFKDGEAWLKYQKTFGEGDAFSAMMGYVKTMARDIAAMEILGPNPDGMIEYLKQVVTKRANGAASAQVDVWRIGEMWDHVRGTSQTPVNVTFANTMGAIRDVITSSALGSAAITSLSDIGTQMVVRRFNGLPAAKTVHDVVRMFGTENRREAVRSGLILDAAMHTLDTQARYVGSLSGPAWSKFVSDRVLTASGLSPMTQAGKHAFGLEVQGTLADMTKHKWGELPRPIRDMLERHGFEMKDWSAIRAAPLYDANPGGRTPAHLLRPAEIAKFIGSEQGRRIADRYVMMILRETRHAVVEGTVGAQSLVTGSTRPGTIVGEFVRSALQFKTFPITFLTLHMGRMFQDLVGGRPARGAAYGGAMLISTTFFGALAVQLAEMAGGRDPMGMDPGHEKGRKFWGAAMLKGGGLGIYGDFLFADVNRFGGGLARTAVGPVWDRADTLRKLTVGNALEVAEGKQKTNAGRELTAFLKQNTPGASLWWARLAGERMLFDQLQYLADPEAHAAFRRRAHQRQKEYGNQYYWKPGDTLPQRGPDLSKAWPRQ